MIDEEEVEARRRTWQNFVRIVSYVVLAAASILILMALFLV